MDYDNSKTVRAGSSKEHLDRLDIAVKVENLTVEFQGTPTLLNIDMEVPSGALMAVLGPNNSGKTTLLKTIVGLQKYMAGRVYIFSRETPLKNDIAYVPDRSSVNWQFPTSLYDLAYMGAYNRVSLMGMFSNKMKYDVMEALDRLKLSHIAKKSICELSRGEKHRALLARALVQDARIYVIDEPIVSADEESIEIILDVIKELNNKKKTVIVAHHDTVSIPKYFDMVTFINTKIIASGKVSEMLTEENFDATYGAKSSIFKNITSLADKSDA